MTLFVELRKRNRRLYITLVQRTLNVQSVVLAEKELFPVPYWWNENYDHDEIALHVLRAADTAPDSPALSKCAACGQTFVDAHQCPVTPQPNPDAFQME